jgi:tripartite-type tricarboxylate transporter receptor subunit TctC
VFLGAIMPNKIYRTKTRYTAGLQCLRRLWLNTFQLWAFSDAHVGSDDKNGRKSLADAIAQSESGGNEGGPPFDWDISIMKISGYVEREISSRSEPASARHLDEATMKALRRQFLRLTGGAIALPAMSWIAKAQAYPSQPVRIVVGFAAGGGTDILARLMGLSERFGRSFIIENRPGAGTNIATEAVVNAPPDGHTLLLVTASNAVNATFYERLNFNFIRDIAPVASMIQVPLVIVAYPALPAKTVSELIAFARANPGRINMASGGTGAPDHVSGELFNMMTGINMAHVPYRGLGPALTDLLGGQVQVTFSSVPAAIEYIRAGKLRALAITTATRSEALPDIPTVREFIPGYESSQWYGVGAPRSTPAEIIDRLNKEINAALADRKIKARLAELGGTAFAGSPAEVRWMLERITVSQASRPAACRGTRDGLSVPLGGDPVPPVRPTPPAGTGFRASPPTPRPLSSFCPGIRAALMARKLRPDLDDAALHGFQGALRDRRRLVLDARVPIRSP